jgi:murein DD-endopeptidase MepM/ murein hydrolase activator NlpD
MRPSSLTRTLFPLAAVGAALLVLASAAMAALGDRTLRQGMSGDDVMELQRLVTELGHPTPRYGTFTSRTKADILDYERDTGLRVNGEVDPSEGRTIVRRARERREAMSGPTGPSTRSYDYGERTLYRGLRGHEVLTLQRLVTRLGHPTPRYGTFTRRTKSDMIRYERSTGLQVNGVVSVREQRTIARRAGSGESSHDHVFPVRGSHSYGGAGSRFGAPRNGHSHGGQDVSAASGTPLVAVTNGRVTQVRYQAGGAGYYVVIQGDDRYDYVYMHLRESASSWVSPGQRVRVGHQLGRVGSTGASTGPHLHFEMWTPHWFDGGHRIDPLPALRRWDAYS